jgi:hypothetical protein
VKSTNYLIQALTPVLLSPFAEGSPGYVSVTGDNSGGSTAGFRAPFRITSNASDNRYGNTFNATLNEVACYPRSVNTGVTGSFPYLVSNPSYNFNVSLVSAFEVMAKYYQGNPQTINGVTLTKNKFWIFAAYRGSQDDGSLGANANTLNATFTVANTGATSVDRIYADAVLGAAAATGFPTRTTIKCGDTSQMVAGQTQVIIAGTTGVPGLNGTFTVQTSNFTAGSAGVPATFDIPLTFSGTFTFQIAPDAGGPATCGAGTIIAIQNILLTGNTTFTDAFTRGSDIRIYRVN